MGLTAAGPPRMASTMANLINLENVSKTWGLKTLLDGVSLGVQTGDRIGVVGLNGGGKTTLLEVLTGIEPPDSGRVSHNSDLRMAVVTQRADLTDTDTIGEVVLAPLGLQTFEWASDARVREVLGGLGVAELGLDTPVGGLSGGERRRVNLAAALVRDLDLVILDEPTNHLDVEGVQWLAEHLIARRIAIVVVTHDRWFLDTVATTTWEVHDGTVDIYEGGYNDWTFARAERARQADAVEQRRQNLARKELAWLRRGAPARTSKPRYRIEAAEALIADVPAPRDSVELTAFSRQRQGKVVIELEDARVETPDGRMLVDDLTWRLAPGERIGLVGVNGSGKTTLLRTLVGDLSGGERRRLQLTRVLMAEPNVLLLDEPTNDLDIDTLQELESLLDSWPGTLVVISHDRYLIERISDSTWALFGDGKLTNLPGGIEQYLERRRQLAEAGGSGPLDLGEKNTAGAGEAARQPTGGLSSQEERELKKQLNALERKMGKVADRIATFEQEMAVLSAADDPDYGKIGDANAALQEAQAEHEGLEMEWLELGEKLEG